MVQFQKLTRNLILTLHGQNVHRQCGNCPSFSCATSSSLFMLTAGPRGQYTRWRRSRKRLSVCSVLRCPDLWLQCSVGFRAARFRKDAPWRPRSKHEKRTAGSAWETWTVAAADGVRCARVSWEINFFLTFVIAPFICNHTVYVCALNCEAHLKYACNYCKNNVFSCGN